MESQDPPASVFRIAGTIGICYHHSQQPTVSFIEHLLSSGHQWNPKDTLVNDDDITFLCKKFSAWERPPVHRRHEHQPEESLRCPSLTGKPRTPPFALIQVSYPHYFLPSTKFCHHLLDLNGFEWTIYSLHLKEFCNLLSGKRQEEHDLLSWLLPNSKRNQSSPCSQELNTLARNFPINHSHHSEMSIPGLRFS